MGMLEFNVRRYGSRTAPGSGGETTRWPQPRFHVFERHGGHDPRRSNAAAVHEPHGSAETHAKPPQPQSISPWSGPVDHGAALRVGG